MTRPSALPRIAAWSTAASAPLAFGCLYFALAAVDFDLDAVADPAAAVRSGARGAEMLRMSMIFDTLGYYLLLAPGVLHLDRELRRSDDALATLITACGLGYVLLIGAIGASALAAVCPPLMLDLEHAVGTERDTITIVLRAALDAVHGGLWNFLEMLLAAVFWLGSGAMLRATRPRFAALTITVGAAAAIDAGGETIGVPALASVGLSIYLVLAPIWALCLGVLTVRELRARAPHGVPEVVALLLVGALSGCEDYRVCAPADLGRIEQEPALLSQTGLFDDIVADTLGEGVRAYRPQFELWSDGAAKRRWISLPPGAVIDTSDMDSWRFPEGTRLWKEFTRDGVRVETRMLERVGPSDADWTMVSYLWDDEGTDAVRIVDAVVDAAGTPHDVPSAAQCAGCHGGRESRVLGFSAIQLDHRGSDDEWTLAGLAAAGLLSDVPESPLVVPGDETTRAALGYLHANCGHCHNQMRPERVGPRCFEPQNQLDFWFRVDALGTPEETPTWQSAVGSVIKPGDPTHSALVRRADRRGASRMPPLGTEEVDREAIDVLRAWIAAM